MNILCVMPMLERHKKQLESISPAHQFTYTDMEQATREQLLEADIILGSPQVDPIKESKKLKLIQLNCAGTDVYTKNAAAMPKQTVLCNASGAFGSMITEHMLAMLLCLMKNLNGYLSDKENKIWKSRGTVTTIAGARVLIVGLGDIGEEFAKNIKLLGGHPIGIKRTIKDKPDFVEELYTMEQLDELLPTADVVALCLPANPATIGLFDEQRLLKIKKDGILLNVGRGNVVSTQGLVKVLEQGHLAGVGLDVVEIEPLEPTSPLWKFDNVIITPHVAGEYFGTAIHDNMVNIACHNIQAVEHQLSLKNVVDYETGCRVKVNMYQRNPKS